MSILKDIKMPCQNHNSNYSYRSDVRTESGFKRDISQGYRNEFLISKHFIEIVNSLYYKSIIKYYIPAYVMLDTSYGQVNTGEYSDRGDLFIVLTNMKPGFNRNITENDPIKMPHVCGVIDIKAMSKKHDIFTFKDTEIDRCLKNKWIMIHAQRFGNENCVLKIFDSEQQETIKNNFQLKSIKYMGNKLGYQLKEKYFNDWMDYDTLSDINDQDPDLEDVSSFSNLTDGIEKLWKDLEKQSSDFNEYLRSINTYMSGKYYCLAAMKYMCQLCSVGRCYNQVVLGEGNPVHPIFMFVGEAPGKDEIEHKRPFIGAAGQILRKYFRESSIFNRRNSFVSNVIPCRPKNNKFPSKNELYNIFKSNTGFFEGDGDELVEQCRVRWLDREIDAISPRIIVTLGNQPLKWILGKEGVGRHRAVWQYSEKYKAWIFPTYHPAALLWSKDNTIERRFYGDLDKLSKEYANYAGPGIDR